MGVSFMQQNDKISGSEEEEEEESPLASPTTTVQHVINCSYSSWHENYRHLTPKSIIIKPLPKSFLEYLQEDGIRLPPSGPSAEWSDDDEDEGYPSDQEYQDPTHEFQDLHTEIQAAIEALGGHVMPKLNWSSPKDASWIMTANTLKCSSASDVYMLLKSSSFISHDLNDPFENCIDDNETQRNKVQYELVLRQWFNLNPSMEFRCFVINRQLIGISQRDENFYDFLQPLKDSLSRQIFEFFNVNLKYSFPDEDFCFDIYFPNPYNKIWLIDINPANKQTTDSLLFNWNDDILSFKKKNNDSNELEIRLVSQLDQARPFASTQYSAHKMPKDVVDASATGQGIAEMIQNYNEFSITQQSHDDDQ